MEPARGLLLALAFLSASCISTMTDFREDVGAVGALLDRQQAAWNAGDVEAFMAEGYWASEELTFLSGGDWTRGYDAVLRRYRDRYQSAGAEMGTLTFADVQVVPLGPDAALARGRYHLDFSSGPPADGLFSLVLRRLEDGRWRIVHDHTSSAN